MKNLQISLKNVNESLNITGVDVFSETSMEVELTETLPFLKERSKEAAEKWIKESYPGQERMYQLILNVPGFTVTRVDLEANPMGHVIFHYTLAKVIG